MPARRNDEKASELYALYTQGKTLREIGKMYGLSNQSIYSMFQSRNWPTRPQTRLPFVEFNGKKYTRKPSGYYAVTDTSRTMMHRDVWEFYNGPIPEGHQVHHKDGDRGNNAIENLMLVERSDHSRRHMKAKMHLHVCPHCGGLLFPDD